MAITHTTAVRNVLADTFDDQVNAGTTDAGGDVVISDNPTVVVTITFQNPAFGAAATGVITLAGVPLSNTASATGAAVDEFIIQNRDNTQVLDGTVTVTSGGGDIEVNNTSINSGQTVEITSMTYTAPP